MLQFARILPKLFALLRHFVGLLSELACALFDGALHAVKPKHVGFILLDACFKGACLGILLQLRKAGAGAAWAL